MTTISRIENNITDFLEIFNHYNKLDVSNNKLFIQEIIDSFRSEIRFFERHKPLH